MNNIWKFPCWPTRNNYNKERWRRLWLVVNFTEETERKTFHQNTTRITLYWSFMFPHIFAFNHYYTSKKIKRMEDIWESMFSLFDSFLYFSLSSSFWRHGSFVFEFHLSQEHFLFFHTMIETMWEIE